MRYNLITILGPTATGKTRLAVQLANKFNGEIISADSRQVYRGMNIGTGKDLADYVIDGKQIPYHLIDIIEPTEEFDLYKFQQMFYKIFNDVSNKNKLPFIVGGTGMYLSSILQDYNLRKADFEKAQQAYSALSNEELKNILKKLNPDLHNTTDLNDRTRILKAIAVTKAHHHSEPDLSWRTSENSKETDFPIAPLPGLDRNRKINSINIGISLSREKIKKNITSRLKKRLDEGMIYEVKELMDQGVTYEKLIFFGLEYKFIAQYLKGELNKNDMFQKLNSAIHSFAKRQMTWFRKMEREGVKIYWIDGPDFNKAKKLIEINL